MRQQRQLDGQVLVLHVHAGIHVQRRRCEIPQHADPRGHHGIGHSLGGLGGHSNDAHIHLVAAGDLSQILDGLDGEPGHVLADDVRVVVKEGDDAQSARGKAGVGRQRAAQIAGAYHDAPFFAAQAQRQVQLVGQSAGLIAASRAALLLDPREILAHLGGGDARGDAKLARGHVRDALVDGNAETSPIEEQAAQAGRGDGLLWHLALLDAWALPGEVRAPAGFRLLRMAHRRWDMQSIP